MFVIDLSRRLTTHSIEFPSICGCFQTAISPDSKYAAVATDRAFHLVDIRQGKIVLSHETGDVAKCVAFSPDGRWLAGGGQGGSLHRIHLPSLQPAPPIAADAWSVQSVAFAPRPGDSRMVVCGGDNRVKIFDVESGELLHEFEQVPQFLVAAKFSPSGRRVVTGGVDGKVRIWHAETGDELLDLDYQPDWFAFPEFSPDGRSLMVSHGIEVFFFFSADPDQLGPMSMQQLEEYACTNILQASW
jgi:WD40 repeat protein